MPEGFWETSEGTEGWRPERSQFPKRSKGRFWKMMPDKLDVYPQRTTVVKKN